MAYMKKALMRLQSVFWLTFLASLIPMYFVTVYGQDNWGFDNIGLWYTVYCAVVFAIALAGALVALVAMGRKASK